MFKERDQRTSLIVPVVHRALSSYFWIAQQADRASQDAEQSLLKKAAGLVQSNGPAAMFKSESRLLLSPLLWSISVSSALRDDTLAGRSWATLQTGESTTTITAIGSQFCLSRH